MSAAAGLSARWARARLAPWGFWILTVALALLAEAHDLIVPLGLTLALIALGARTPMLADRGAGIVALGLGAAGASLALVPDHAAVAAPALFAWSVLLAAVMRLRSQALRELGAWSSARARMAADVSMVFGAGLGRPGPGTVGSLSALALGPALLSLPPLARGVILLVGTALAVFATRAYLTHAVSSDPSEVVVDEILGCAIALAFLPTWSLGWAAASFVAFRVFDIAKPWPVGAIDRGLKGAHGVVLDDVAAGLMAGAVVTAARLAT